MTMYQATVPPAFSWGSQVSQYPESGAPGISYFAGDTDLGTVDCLLYRDDDGKLLGILNHYPHDFPPWEEAGNVNVFVEPGHQRRGIATKLWDEAVRRWQVDLDRQRFTVEGAAWANALAARKDRDVGP